MANLSLAATTAQALFLLALVAGADPGSCGVNEYAPACIQAAATADLGVEKTREDDASLLQTSGAPRAHPAADLDEQGPATVSTVPEPEHAAHISPPDMSDLHCRPVDRHGRAIGLQNRVRREIHLWTDGEFAKFSHAVNILYHRPGSDLSLYPTTYASIVASHKMCHQKPNHFFPWHRHLLYDFETVLQNISGDCELTLPFWNSNAEAGDPWTSVVFASNRYGMRPACSLDSPQPGEACRGHMSIPGKKPCHADVPDEWGSVDDSSCIDEGIAANWTVSDHSSCILSGVDCSAGLPPSDPKGCHRCVKRRPEGNFLIPYSYVILELSTEQNFEAISRWIEFTPHPAPHTSLFGGSMAPIQTSPSDPAFFLHHAHMDNLFTWWQRYHLVWNGVDTSTCDSCSGEVLPFYNESFVEWMGKFDRAAGCVMLPASDPRVCLSYQSHVSIEKPKGDGEPTCTEILKKFEFGECDAQKIRSSIQRTYQSIHAADMKEVCEQWISNTPEHAWLSDEAQRTQIHLCDAIVDRMAENEETTLFAEPASDEERKLGFKCTPELANSCETATDASMATKPSQDAQPSGGGVSSSCADCDCSWTENGAKCGVDDSSYCYSCCCKQ